MGLSGGSGCVQFQFCLTLLQFRFDNTCELFGQCLPIKNSDGTRSDAIEAFKEIRQLLGQELK